MNTPAKPDDSAIESELAGAQHKKRVKKCVLERIALVLGLCVITGSIWFWYTQIQSVLEILEMAYG